MSALRHSVLALGLIAIVFAANAPTWDYGFVYDDQAVIIDRPPASQQGFKKFLATRQWGTGRHAVALSFDLNRTEPLVAPPFHVVNTVLAAIAVVLVFELALTLSISPATAFLASSWFAVHPAHTDAIVSIVGRAELLAGVCVLGCVLLHVRGYPHRALSLTAAALVFLIGLASKESALVLPLLLALHDVVLAPARRRAAVITPYLAYGAAALAWFALVSRNLGTLDPIAYVDNPLAFQPFYERILRAAAVLWHYLGILIVPISLKPDRGYAATTPSLVEGAVATVAWLVLLVSCWRARKRYPRAVFATLWFPAAFSVTANIIYPVGTIMAERLLFVPSVGIALLVGLLVDRAWGAARAGERASSSRGRRVAVAIAGSVTVLLLAFAYDARGRVWTTDQHYHFVAALESPASAKAHYNLGLERARAQDYQAAEAGFRRALEIYPRFGLAAYYLAGVMIETERPEQAIDVFRAYLELEPNDIGALSQLVTLQMSLDRYDEAHSTAERLVALDPENQTHRNLLVTVETLSQAREEIDASVLERQLQDGKAEPPH